MGPIPLWALLLGVLVVHLGVLIPAFITAPHTGGDNAGYLSLAHALVEQGRYVELWDPAQPPHSKYPPGYPLLLAGAMLLGARTWVAFKVLSLGAVAGSVLLSVVWARRRLGTAGALGVGLLLVFSEAFLWASSWILSEPLFLILTLGAVVALEREPGGGLPSRRWLWTGCTLAVLSFLTRTAGLPLLGAVGLWLLFRRAWGAAAAFAVAAGTVVVAWALRGRGVRDEGYLSEFWLLDPYDPEMGTVGVGGLMARAWDNLLLYGGTYIPGGLLGSQGTVVALGGAVLLALAAGGWIRALRRGVGPAELFVPLYLLLILLWPAVWSGDRFALPLYPFLLIYAAECLVWVCRRLMVRAPALTPRVTLWAGVVMVGLVAVPASMAWWRTLPTATGCRALVVREGPFACYADSMRELMESARWSGAFLPEDAVVFSRKPRLFYAVSGGIRSLTFPLRPDPDLFFREADRAGVRYVVLDRTDGLAVSYVLPALEAHPERFCSLAGWGNPEQIRTEMLGLLPAVPPGAEDTGPPGEDEDVIALLRCSPDFVAPTPRPEIPYASSSVPLLDRPASAR